MTLRRLTLGTLLPIPPDELAREFFFHDVNRQHLQLLDEAARRSGLSRGEVFADFLHMGVCALSGGQLEDQYMDVVKRHSDGKPGKRSCDTLAQLYGSVIDAMETDCREGMQDVLGDLFEGAISYGENGLYLSPMPVCRAMSLVTVGEEEEQYRNKSVCDPACGSGRMLMAVAERYPHWEFIGIDIDMRAVRIATINLALRNIYGYLIHGNSLSLETQRVYRTGFNGKGVVREIPPEACPYAPLRPSPKQQQEHTSRNESAVKVIEHQRADDDDRPLRQGSLF